MKILMVSDQIMISLSKSDAKVLLMILQSDKPGTPLTDEIVRQLRICFEHVPVAAP